MTAQGSALTRYRRAVERRHLFGADSQPARWGYVSLRDALGLLALYAAEDSPKYDKAAVRWLARLARSRATIFTSAMFNSQRPHSGRCRAGPPRRCSY